MACPSISYGIPLDGAKDLSFNSGRELFRCGTDCVTMFITNVSLELSTRFIKCGTITDAHVSAGGGDACMQSAQVNWRDQSVVNWEAKTGVHSGLENGTVITRAADCAGEGYSVYTHSEGQVSGRCNANICDFAENTFTEAVKDAVLNKVNTVDSGNKTSELEWIFSDVATQSSATDWQGGTVSYLGFGVMPSGGDRTYNFSFNWQNGRSEMAEGTMTYDEDPNPELLSNIIGDMLTKSGFCV